MRDPKAFRSFKSVACDGSGKRMLEADVGGCTQLGSVLAIFDTQVGWRLSFLSLGASEWDGELDAPAIQLRLFLSIVNSSCRSTARGRDRQKKGFSIEGLLRLRQRRRLRRLNRSDVLLRLLVLGPLRNPAPAQRGAADRREEEQL